MADISGETETNVSGWTTDTLHAHIERRIDDLGTRLERRIDDLSDRLDERAVAQDKAVDAALTSAKEAVNKAEKASAAKFEDQNEFREQLKDQAATFLTRNEYHGAHEALRAQLNAMESRMNVTQGKALGMNALVVLAFGVIGAIAAIVIITNVITSH